MVNDVEYYYSSIYVSARQTITNPSTGQSVYRAIGLPEEEEGAAALEHSPSKHNDQGKRNWGAIKHPQVAAIEHETKESLNHFQPPQEVGALGKN